MDKRLILFVFVFLFFMSFVSAGTSYSNSKYSIPKSIQQITNNYFNNTYENVTNEYYNVTQNITNNITNNITYEANLTNVAYTNESYSTQWYNHTSAVYNLWNLIWSSTYNSTYDAKVSYIYGNCPAGQVVMNTTANGVQCVVPPAGEETDPIWTANSTLVAYLINQGNWNVNRSNFWDNLDSPDSAWLSTYNSTYAIWTYNQTIPANTYTDTKTSTANLHTHAGENITALATWLTTYNATYDAGKIWWYNMTTPSNTYTDTKTSTANLHTHAYQNLTGTTTATDCSGTDKVTDVTITNGAVTTTCGTDQTGAGGGATQYFTTADRVTGNITHFNATVLTMPVSANTNYTIQCTFWAVTSLATVGVQLNMTVPASPLVFNGAWIAPTTAVASLYAYCQNTARDCIESQTAALTTGLPIYFNGRLENVNANSITVKLKAEAAGTVTIKKGSYCILNSGGSAG